MLLTLGLETKSLQPQPVQTFSYKSTSLLMFSISFGLLIPQEFSPICPLLVNLAILKYPICFLGSQFSLAFVCSDLTDNSMNLIFLQQTKTIKVLCYRIQSSSLGGRRYCGQLQIEMIFFYYLYFEIFREKKI